LRDAQFLIKNPEYKIIVYGIQLEFPVCTSKSLKEFLAGHSNDLANPDGSFTFEFYRKNG